MSLVQALRATKAALRAAAADGSADADALARALIGGNPLPEAGARDATWRARIGSLHNEEVTVISMYAPATTTCSPEPARARNRLFEVRRDDVRHTCEELATSKTTYRARRVTTVV